jgi:DNA-binding NtrC family response regulator
MAFLLVDADRNFREALAIALRLDGHMVLTAAGPADALPLLARGGVRCCVVDWCVEQLDELLETAARAGARVVLTGVHASLVASTARRHAHVEPLPKPFGVEALLQRRAG